MTGRFLRKTFLVVFWKDFTWDSEKKESGEANMEMAVLVFEMVMRDFKLKFTLSSLNNCNWSECIGRWAFLTPLHYHCSNLSSSD